MSSPIPVSDPKDIQEINAVDAGTRTNITYDMFVLSFFQELFQDPMRGRIAEDEDGDMDSGEEGSDVNKKDSKTIK